jgi:hypothetical protein
VINVNSAAVETSLSAVLNDSPSIKHLLGQGKTSAPQAAVAKPATVTVQTVPGGGTAAAIQGTMVPGASLAAKLAWLQKSADSHNTYIVEVTANENIAPHTFEYKGAINITIVLKGDRTNRTVKLQSHGNMFTVRPNVILILDNNITLHGHNGNTGALINVNGGEFRMNTGSYISNNTNISSAEDAGGGGGIHITSGTFTMNGGTISGNTARGGAGVWIGGDGSFTMKNGTISGNRATYGGGVDVNKGIFTMNGGTISGNIATYGGGVGVNEFKTFTMKGGIITGNTAFEFGGGVNGSANFIKSGGIITGYKSDQNNGNVVKDESGNVLARKGHAIYIGEQRRKETTAGPGENLSHTKKDRWSKETINGAWDE